MKKIINVTLGVSGGIAAYKSAELCRLLVKNNYQVQVVMTENAAKFVTPLTFATLTRRSVVTSLWDNADWRPEHVALADWTHLLVIAPATADILGKYANGIADDALSTLCISVDCPVLLAPAMNPKMWRNPMVRRNVELLKATPEIHFAGPVDGMVACGADGVGRMMEPLDIFAEIRRLGDECA